jgi:hypothetical protein
MPDANYSAVAAQVTDGYATRVDVPSIAIVRIVTFVGTTISDASSVSVAIFR